MNRTYDSSFENQSNSIYKAFNTLLTIIKDNRIETRDCCYISALEETLLFHCFQSIWKHKLNSEKLPNSSSLSCLSGISQEARPLPLISFNNSLTSLNIEIINYIRSLSFDLLLQLPPLIHDYFLSIKPNSSSDVDKDNMLSGSRKKIRGIYYTPQWIAEKMTKASLQPFLDKFLMEMKTAVEKDSIEDFSQVWKKAVNFKILDPACGWGIFLINAFRLLQSFYNECGMLAKRLIESVEIKNSRTHALYNHRCYALVKDASFAGENPLEIILSKNIFGFDIDETALKIMKNLILAQSSAENICSRERQSLCSSLSSHIIKRDFIKEYSQIEHKFDVILGNPPYFSIGGGGRKREKTPYHILLKNHPFLGSYFRSQSDIFYYFIIGSIHLLKQEGILSFITPSYWFDNDYADKLRKEILEKCRIKEIIRFDPYKVFYSIKGKPINVDTSIFRLKRTDSVVNKSAKQQMMLLPLFENDDYNDSLPKEKIPSKSHVIDDNKFEVYLFNKDFNGLTDSIKSCHNNYISLQKEFFDNKLIREIYSQKHLSAGRWNFTSCQSILDVMKKDGKTIFPLGDISSREREKFESEFTAHGGKECEGLAWIGQGQETGLSEVFVLKDEDVLRLNLEKELLRSNIKNGHIRRYILLPSKQQIILTLNHHSMEEYPNTLKYLSLHKNKLLERQRVKIGVRQWYAVSIPQNYDLFAKEEKIVVPYRAAFNRFAIDRQGCFNDGGDVRAVAIKNENLHDINHNVLLAILNSKLLNFWFMQAGKGKGGMYEYFSRPLSRIPVKIPSSHAASLLNQYSISLQKLYRHFNDENSCSRDLKKDISFLKKEIEENENKIDEAVFELYGIIYEQKSIVLSTIKESHKSW